MTRQARLVFWVLLACLVSLVLFGHAGPVTLIAGALCAVGMIACLGWKS